nr:MAG TPA: hypothetical protein [Caudoviricetes sp.]
MHRHAPSNFIIFNNKKSLLLGSSFSDFYVWYLLICITLIQKLYHI